MFCAFKIINAQNTFNLNYTSGVKSGAYACEVINANNYLVSSYYNDSSNGRQGLDLKRINNQGAVTMRKRFLFSNYDFLSYLNNKFQCNISNSTLLVSGAGYSNSASVVIIASVNKGSLDTNWTKYYHDGIYNYNLNNSFKVKPNEFWLFGNKYNNSGYTDRPFALKVDSFGNVLSSKTYSVFIKHLIKVVYFDTTTKLLYVGGNNYTIPQAPVEFIACIDTVGNVIWNNQSIGPVAFGQLEKKNNYIVIAGQYYAGDFAPPSTINPTYKLHLLKINSSNGSIIWQKSYGQARATNYLTSLVVNNDESIVTVGSYFPKTVKYAGVTDGIFLKVNSVGDSLWSRTYGNFGGDVQEAFYDIKKTTDGGYIASGVPFYASDPTSQSWVVKTDSLGMAPGITTRVQNFGLNNEEFVVYPNPAKDDLNISAKENRELITKIEICDVSGKLVREENLCTLTETLHINTSDLNNGVYLLKIMSTNCNCSIKLVITR